MSFSLRDRRVLLTGASGGIGHALARSLHARGATVIATARRTDVLDRLASELGDRVETVTADLADRAAVGQLVERAGRVDALVANAALPASGPVESFSADEMDRALDVNLRAPIQLARELAPAMVARGEGSLAFIGSLSSKVASPGGALYSATKFGMRGYALGLREDLAASGVGVSLVYPGFIRDAGMFHDSGTKLPPFVATRTPEQVAEATVAAIERGRVETDVAPLLLRIGGWAGGLAPALIGNIQRRLGGGAVAGQMERGQRAKR